MIKLLERGTFQNYRWFGVTEHIPSDEGPNTVVKIGHGCNGRLHVDAFTVLVLDEHGMPIDGRDGGCERRGPCNGSCGNVTATPPDGTGFVYPVPSCAEIGSDDISVSN